METSKFTLTNDLADEIMKVVQLDIDAVLAYTQAIDGIEAAHLDVRNQLEIFKSDHERHIVELGDALLAGGHTPPEFKRDAKGFLIEGMTAIRSAIGTKQALKAMRQNEVLTNKKYDEALGLQGVLDDLREILVRGREDERRHLDYIEQAIERFEAYGEAAQP